MYCIYEIYIVYECFMKRVFELWIVYVSIMFCILELCARNEYFCHITYIILKIIERLWTVHVTYMRFADLFMVLL
jgi:hypothetical protein